MSEGGLEVRTGARTIEIVSHKIQVLNPNAYLLQGELKCTVIWTQATGKKHPCGGAELRQLSRKTYRNRKQELLIAKPYLHL